MKSPVSPGSLLQPLFSLSARCYYFLSVSAFLVSFISFIFSQKGCICSSVSTLVAFSHFTSSSSTVTPPHTPHPAWQRRMTLPLGITAAGLKVVHVHKKMSGISTPSVFFSSSTSVMKISQETQWAVVTFGECCVFASLARSFVKCPATRLTAPRSSASGHCGSESS